MIERQFISLGKLLYYLIMNILLVPLACLLLLGKATFRIRFVRLIDNRIGHLAANTELFLRSLDLQGKKKMKRFFVGIASDQPSNHQLLNMYKREFCIIQLPRELYGNRVFMTVSSDYSLLNWLKVYYDLPFESNESKVFSFGNPQLSFTPEEIRKGKELLASMGVTSWYVCIHARDPVYLSDRDSTNRMSFRDCSIDSYLKSAEHITKKGGFVIRMGAKTEKPLKTSNPRIIDYANLYRSDFGDVFLTGHCRFFLGSSGGLILLATALGVPAIGCNYIPLGWPPLSKNELYLPKKLLDSRTRRFLTFKQIANTDVLYFYDTGSYERAGLVLVENSPEEILEVTKEMMNRLGGKEILTSQDKKNHRQFQEILAACPHHLHPLSRIGSHFLRTNNELLGDTISD